MVLDNKRPYLACLRPSQPSPLPSLCFLLLLEFLLLLLVKLAELLITRVIPDTLSVCKIKVVHITLRRFAAHASRMKLLREEYDWLMDQVRASDLESGMHHKMPTQ